MTTPRPSYIVHTDDVAEETWSYPGSDEKLCPGRPIGRIAGLLKTGVHVERLLPGTRTSWPHAEADEEEWAYVISGTPSVWLDGVVHALRAGDFVALPAGTGICHTFLNDSDVDAVVLVGGERSQPEHKIFYPLHPERKDVVGEARWWPVSWEQKGEHDGRPRRRDRRDG
jgi:uncharacterized cupin superfamily protein